MQGIRGRSLLDNADLGSGSCCWLATLLKAGYYCQDVEEAAA